MIFVTFQLLNSLRKFVGDMSYTVYCFPASLVEPSQLQHHGPSQLGKERTAAWKQAFQIAFLSDSLLAIHKNWLMSQSPDA
jgi:hypothetical protein